MGIIGGRPKHSVYFVGFQGTEHLVMVRTAPMDNPLPSEEKLLHLDPHYSQPTVNMTLEEFDIKVNTS